MCGCRKRTVLWKEDRGSLLIMLLLFSSVMMILGAALLSNSLQERIIAQNYLYKLKAHYLAEAGVELALTFLEEEPEHFWQLNFDEPLYPDNGVEEEYYVLQWLEPGCPGGNEEYYTLISRGICRRSMSGVEAQAEIRALLSLNVTTGKGDEPEEEVEGEEEDGGEEECEKQTQVLLIGLSGM